MRNTFDNLKDFYAYVLPLAAFFILISTAVTNTFLVIAAFIGFVICVSKREYLVLYEKKILLLCIILFFVLLISYLYTAASNLDVILSLKKYIKFIYIPFIYYYIKEYKNENLVIKYFIYGSTFILFLSYLKYFNVFDFNMLYKITSYIQFNYTKYNIIETKSVIFQNYIISGVVICFLCFINLIIGIKKKNIANYLISLFAFVYIIYMNDSRTSYIIISLLSFIIFYKYFFKRKFIFYVAPILVASIIIYSPFSENLTKRISVINQDVVKIFNQDFDSSSGMRYGWILCGIKNVVDKPFTGYGVGSYKKSLSNCFDVKEANLDEEFITNNPHNEFISLSTQLGLGGLFLYILFLYNLYVNSKNNTLAQGIFIIVLVSSIFNSAIYDNILGLFIVLLISITHQLSAGYSMSIKKLYNN